MYICACTIQMSVPESLQTVRILQCTVTVLSELKTHLSYYLIDRMIRSRARTTNDCFSVVGCTTTINGFLFFYKCIRLREKRIQMLCWNVRYACGRVYQQKNDENTPRVFLFPFFQFGAKNVNFNPESVSFLSPNGTHFLRHLNNPIESTCDPLISFTT